MRRLILFLFAVVLALSVSSFAAKKSAPVVYYYQDGSGTWRMIALSNPPCPAGPFANCFYLIGSTPRQIYVQPNLDSPYLRD